jgi:hypothetical protein
MTQEIWALSSFKVYKIRNFALHPDSRNGGFEYEFYFSGYLRDGIKLFMLIQILKIFHYEELGLL